MAGSGFGIIDSYTLMQGMTKYIMSGAVPGLNRVEYHAPDKGAYTEGDCIFLPSPAATGTEEDVLLWRYYAEHEMGHEDEVNCHPHWLTVMNAHRNKGEKQIDDLFWSIANCLSDHVQEHNRVGVMVGRDYVLGEGRRVFMQRSCNIKDAVDCKMAGLAAMDWDARLKWNPFLSGHQLFKDAKKWPLAVEWGKKFSDAVDITALRNEQDVFEAAKKIRALFTEEEAKQHQQERKDGGKPKPGGAGKNPCSMADHGKEADAEAEKGKSKKVSRDGIPSGIRDPRDARKGDGTYVSRKPLSLKEALKEGAHCRELVEYGSKIKDAVKKTNLPSRVRSHLLSRKAIKYTSGYRSGKLDTGRLTDVLRGKDDVFRRKEDKRTMNTAVSLLVDASGSMHGNNYTGACAAAVMMAEALQGIGVDVEIAGFTEVSASDKGLVHEIITPFGQRFVKDRVIAAFGELGKCLNNNADGENILYAYNRLRHQQQPKKILIVLSDGSPAAYGSGMDAMSIVDFTQKVIKTVEADKSVEIWGIGMDYTPQMYKKRISIRHGDALEPALLSLVQNFIEGHG